MIRIQYAPELVEQAVRLVARSDAATEAGLHNAIDPIFGQPDSEERERLFQEAFGDWFTRLQLDRFLDESLSHFPRIVEGIERAFVDPAPRRRSQGAELFVRNEQGAIGRTLAIQVCPESLADPQSTRDPMLRELQHVEDMLDQDFAYKPESIDGLPSRQQLVRDRYRILWDIRVEAILADSGLLERSDESRLRGQYERVFTIAGVRPQSGLFERIWKGERVAHPQLLAWAKIPDALVQGAAGQRADGPSRPVGVRRPECGCPTLD